MFIIIHYASGIKFLTLHLEIISSLQKRCNDVYARRTPVYLCSERLIVDVLLHLLQYTVTLGEFYSTVTWAKGLNLWGKISNRYAKS